MTNETTAQLRTELAAPRERVATQEALLAGQRPAGSRGRGWGRAYARRAVVAALALLVALVPLSIFAAGFTDLNANSPHNDNINAIAAVGITKGCNPPAYDNYCPNDVVTREQMASFLARTAGLGGNPPVANAATALNATNAAQLGGQTPSFYQPAGQPIANATNATQLGGQPAGAYQLTSQPIANAINAAQLGGQPASAYVQKSAAFVHTATASNTLGALTYMDTPLTTGHPNAIILVTSNRTANGSVVVDAHPLDVYYIGSGPSAKWAIVNSDGASIPANASFNILVINP